ncbi:MAG: hypothetical protein PWQ49_604 [Methanohalophilus sp.]|nr:hypothetical protein [Methanohalophilus sp.]
MAVLKDSKWKLDQKEYKSFQCNLVKKYVSFLLEVYNPIKYNFAIAL